MENLLRVGFKAKVVNEDRVEFGEVGTVVRIASNSIDKFYVVDFVGKSYVYFEEEELVPYVDEEVMEVHSIELEEQEMEIEEEVKEELMIEEEKENEEE